MNLITLLSAGNSVIGMGALLVPRDIPFQVDNLGTLASALTDWRCFASVLFTASFLAVFIIPCIYAGPLLESTVEFGRNGVTMVLILFGVGFGVDAVMGNFLGGYLSDKLGPYRTLRGLCIAQTLSKPLLSVLPYPDALLWALVLIWLAWTIHETPNPFTRPFFCSGFCEGAEYRLYFRLSRIRYRKRGCGRIWRFHE